MPVEGRQVIGSVSDRRGEVATLAGLSCESAVAIAHVSERTLRDAITALNDSAVDAISIGTRWRALRQNGITDTVQGFGALLEKH